MESKRLYDFKTWIDATLERAENSHDVNILANCIVEIGQYLHGTLSYIADLEKALKENGIEINLDETLVKKGGKDEQKNSPKNT